MYFFGGAFVEDVCVDRLYYGVGYCVCGFRMFLELFDLSLRCTLIDNIFFETMRVIFTYEMMKQ